MMDGKKGGFNVDNNVGENEGGFKNRNSKDGFSNICNKETVNNGGLGEVENRELFTQISREIPRLLEFYRLLDEGYRSADSELDIFYLDEFSVSKLIQIIKDFELLKMETYEQLKNVLDFNENLKHDLNNLVFIFLRLQVLLNDLEKKLTKYKGKGSLKGKGIIPLGDLRAQMLDIREGIPPCVAVVECSLARRSLEKSDFEPNFFEMHARSLNLKMLKKVVEFLCGIEKSKGHLRGRFNSKGFEPEKGFPDDKEVITVPGVVGSLIAEMVRNAVRPNRVNIGNDGENSELVQAANVHLISFIEGDELIIRIIDDGIGMSPELIKENGGKSIFSRASYSGSSGSGLYRAPELIHRSKGELRYYSIDKREKSDGLLHASDELSKNDWASLGKNEEELAKAKLKMQEVEARKQEIAEWAKKVNPNYSTVVEIRLKITKKLKYEN